MFAYLCGILCINLISINKNQIINNKFETVIKNQEKVKLKF